MMHRFLVERSREFGGIYRDRKHMVREHCKGDDNNQKLNVVLIE